MAAGFDGLVNFLLAEIALCGNQGAGSADFYRFIREYYNEESNERQGSTVHQNGPSSLSSRLGCNFYEKVWEWISNHPDIRIIHRDESRKLNLTEFEALERREAAADGAAAQDGGHQAPNPSETVAGSAGNLQLRPSQSLTSLRDALRQKLEGESGSQETPGLQEGIAAHVPHPTPAIPQSVYEPATGEKRSSQDEAYQTGPDAVPTPQLAPYNVAYIKPAIPQKMRVCRTTPARPRQFEPVFDQPSVNSTVPRLFASQGRAWQALTGHAFDLNKVPSMEFALLSIIARRGVDGITQPELTKIAGQDKRSVPKRTDELARKGYIEKRPIHNGKLRTSLLVHKKFIKTGHFLKTPERIQDVYLNGGTFLLSGFVHVLAKFLKEVGIVEVRDLRRKMGVTVEQWNARSVRNAILRLEESGMLKRVRALKKYSTEEWTVCIKLLREPNQEDINNLGFRSRNSVETTEEPLLEEDADGDVFMRDFELDLVDADNSEDEGGLAHTKRIAPQWRPEQMITNLIFDAVDLTGQDGGDAASLRDRTTGRFWKRPLESLLSRLTDDWGKSQPPHLHHLALIRDTVVTPEKKFVHYLYRSRGNFQKAAEAGEVIWEGVSKEKSLNNHVDTISSDRVHGRPRKSISKKVFLDNWGFPLVNLDDLYRRSGTSSLSECSATIVHPVRSWVSWDNDLRVSLGFKEPAQPRPEVRPDMPLPHLLTLEESQGTGARGEQEKANETVDEDEPTQTIQREKPDSRDDQRSALTPVLTSSVLRKKPRPASAPIPLLTMEQRAALGLPLKGRLTQSIEDQIRAHRKKTGDPLSLPEVIIKAGKVDSSPRTRLSAGPLAGQSPNNKVGELSAQGVKHKRPRKDAIPKAPPLLTKEQRIARGLPPKGRLPQKLVDELLRERGVGMSLDSDDEYVPDGQERHTVNRPNSQTHRATSESPTESFPFLSSTHAPTDAVLTSPSLQDTLPNSLSAAEKRKAGANNAEHELTSKNTRFSSTRLSKEFIEPLIAGNVEVTKPPVDGILGNIHDAAMQTLNSSATGIETSFPSTEKDTSSDIVRAQESAASPGTGQQSVTAVRPRTGRTRARGMPIPENALPQGPNETELKVRQMQVKYENRIEPGLYINPFATRSSGRGRPRKAFIATFRFPRLQELVWFRSESSRHSTSEHAQPSLEIPSRETPSNDPFHGTEPTLNSSPPSRGILAPTALQADALTMPISSAHAEELPRLGVASSGYVPALSRSSITGWNAIDFPNVGSSMGYQSPHGPPPERSADAEGSNTRQLDTTGPTPAHGVSTTTEDRGANSTSPEIVTVETGQESRHHSTFTKKRGFVLGRGTLWRYRAEIIREIVDRCDGVFPCNGELNIVFEALWDQRVSKKIARPDRSTIANTLKSLLQTPVDGLKKLSFQIPGVTAGLSRRIFILARKDLSPTSPQVTEVRDRIIQCWPGRYLPPAFEGILPTAEKESARRSLPEIDESIRLDELDQPTERKLKERINESIRRRKEKLEQRRIHLTGDGARRDAAAASGATTLPSSAGDHVQGQNMRIASLSTSRQVRCDNLMQRTNSPALVDSSANIRPWLRPLLPKELSPEHVGSTEDVPPSSASADLAGHTNGKDSHTNTDDCCVNACETQSPTVYALTSNLHQLLLAFITPKIRFCSTTGTFSTYFRGTEHLEGGSDSLATVTAKAIPEVPRGVKRSRPAEQDGTMPSKHRRLSTLLPKMTHTIVEVGNSSQENIGSMGNSEQENIESQLTLQSIPGPKSKQHRRPPGPIPTLVERLTGLTGDPNAPIYQPPIKKKRTYTTWKDRKEKEGVRRRKERKYPTALDPVDKFKKLCCSLVIASSMSGDGGVDWSIVKAVYSDDRDFNVGKAQRMWSWMRENMAAQLTTLTESFQSAFLEAYEKRKVASIEDPATYDWVSLVNWTLRNCKYPDPPLPLRRETLRDYEIDVSSHEVLDRQAWYNENLAYNNRAERLSNYAFAAPLHASYATTCSSADDLIKARSWIRANTATPQALYKGNLAHDKLKTLGEPVLERVVSEYVHVGFLRLRKIKRLLPGRNYSFTAAFAKNYRRTFELQDFMAAVKLKKDLDTAFANQDPDKRYFPLSRTAENGAVMAVLSLVGGGKIKLVPRLPPVNNDFYAPLPRLSVWGFCEGTYSRRGIDRQRLFWQVDAVPTSAYEFGNPLQPTPFPPVPKENGEPADWPRLPDPPLPGLNDPNALLPIWSNINGQTVTWPWWNRILNLVLGVLMFQPSVTAEEVFRHCPKYTTELFEIELVLSWLQSVNAVQQTSHCTFTVQYGFWAAFGDCLLDEEDDWFGQHVKRHKTNSSKGPWRNEVNLRFSTEYPRAAQGPGRSQQPQGAQDDAEIDSEDEGAGGWAMVQERILHNAKSQYRITKEALEAQPAVAQAQQLLPSNHIQDTSQTQALPVAGPPIDLQLTAKPSNQDIEMVDAPANDAEGEDVDAEGEPDDEML